MAIWSTYFKYFVVFRYILWSFGTFFPVLVRSKEKNLATLSQTSFNKFGKLADNSVVMDNKNNFFSASFNLSCSPPFYV
jgi:hypothetical protein